jgi:hypothetical protein
MIFTTLIPILTSQLPYIAAGAAIADTNTDFLVSIGAQLPLLVLFIWYNERQQKRFDKIQEKRDAEFLSSIKEVTAHVNDAVAAIKEHDNHVERRIQEIRSDATRPFRRSTDMEE